MLVKVTYWNNNKGNIVLDIPLEDLIYFEVLSEKLEGSHLQVIDDNDALWLYKPCKIEYVKMIP